MHKCIGAVKRSGRTMNELNGIIIKFRDKDKLFSKCATKLDYCPTVTGTGKSNFVLYKIRKKDIMKTKMKLIASLKIWLAIYPSITLFYYLFGVQLSELPLYQRTLCLTLLLVPWIVFAGVPFIDAIIKPISIKKTKAKSIEVNS